MLTALEPHDASEVAAFAARRAHTDPGWLVLETSRVAPGEPRNEHDLDRLTLKVASRHAPTQRKVAVAEQRRSPHVAADLEARRIDLRESHDERPPQVPHSTPATLRVHQTESPAANGSWHLAQTPS
jgi:hypothetical protein